MNIKRYLKLFSKWKNPSFLKEGSSEGDWGQYYEVNVKVADKALVTRFGDFDGKKLKVSFLNERFDRDYLIYDASLFDSGSFSGFFRYKGRALEFDSLHDIKPLKRWRFKAEVNIKNLMDTVELRRFRSQEHRVKHQFDVLNAVMEVYMRSNVEAVGQSNVLDYLHGKFWMQHQDVDVIRKDLKLYIEAFISNGDLEYTSGRYFKPTGKAILTLKKYAVDERRYNESNKMQKYMLLTAAFSFVAAAVSAFAAIMTLMNQK